MSAEKCKLRNNQKEILEIKKMATEMMFSIYFIFQISKNKINLLFNFLLYTSTNTRI